MFYILNIILASIKEKKDARCWNGSRKIFWVSLCKAGSSKNNLKTFPLLLYIHGKSCLKILRIFFTITNEWVGDKETHMLWKKEYSLQKLQNLWKMQRTESNISRTRKKLYMKKCKAITKRADCPCAWLLMRTDLWKENVLVSFTFLSCKALQHPENFQLVGEQGGPYRGRKWLHGVLSAARTQSTKAIGCIGDQTLQLRASGFPVGGRRKTP